MNEYRKGQICYIRRYNVPSSANGRMAVIVSANHFNNGENVVVCYFSKSAFEFPCIRTGGSAGSYIVPHPVTVSKDRVSTSKRAVSEAEQEAIDRELRRVMGF